MPGRGDRGGIEKPKDAKGTLKRILIYLSAFKWALCALIIISFISNLANLLGPFYAGKAISVIASGQGHVNMAKVFFYAKALLIVYISSGLLTLTVSIGMTRAGRKVAQNMRRDVFDKLMKLPVGYFDRHPAGDIISHVSYDIDVVSTSLSTDLVTALTSFVTVIGSFIMMCSISLPLVACMIWTIPIAIIYTRHMSKLTKPRYLRRSQAYGDLNGFVEEMFTGQKTILAYAKEDIESERFKKINKAAAKAYLEADGLGMKMGPTIGLVNNLGLSSIGLLGSILYLLGSADLGQLSSFILYSRKFSGPINELANIISEIFSALAAAERVFTLLDEKEEMKDADFAQKLKKCQGDVQFNDVSFGYNPDVMILHHLNFHAKPGQTIAIVGPTGAGKTTIISLLMRFYDPSKGKINIDDKEYHHYTRESLRRSYAMVLQDTWLFQGTIFENIAYGKENATMDEVVSAAKAAHIHNFIMQLPNGYHTIIAEDGFSLSKGQKQLLTIARAMLYDTSMLILDEATSNVDTSTERQVQTSMRELMKGKTCFVIAHRLSTIQNADTILAISHGDVIEQGTHEKLMARKGFYYQLYISQFS